MARLAERGPGSVQPPAWKHLDYMMVIAMIVVTFYILFWLWLFSMSTQGTVANSFVLSDACRDCQDRKAQAERPGSGPWLFNQNRQLTSDRLLDAKQIKKKVLYKGRWMVPFRVLVRLKIFQLGGIAALAIPLATFLSEGGISAASLGIAGALLLGCGMSATTLNYYSRRYVGELTLVTQPPPEHPALCFSVLDFWGNREEAFVLLSDLDPPLKGVALEGIHAMALQPLIPVKVDGERQFYLSLRYGILADKAELVEILKGSHALQRASAL